MSDTCVECGDLIDITKRVYRGRGGLPRCPICQVSAEMRLEIVKVTAMVDILNALDAAEGRPN